MFESLICILIIYSIGCLVTSIFFQLVITTFRNYYLWKLQPKMTPELLIDLEESLDDERDDASKAALFWPVTLPAACFYIGIMIPETWGRISDHFTLTDQQPDNNTKPLLEP